MSTATIPTEHIPLSNESFTTAVEELAEGDTVLAQIVEEHGHPPMRCREPTFEYLVKIILEQQVSLAAANAVFARLQKAVVPFTPARFLELDDDTIRAAGVSRQKIAYCNHLSQTINDGKLRLDTMPTLTNAGVRTALMQVKGIGRWTADIYLLMAMKRPDIWPKGDLALAVALKELKRLRKLPNDKRYDSLARPWRPWRAVAARILWHYYVSTRRKGK